MYHSKCIASNQKEESISMQRVLLFSAVNKAYKILKNEEAINRCTEIIDEAKDRVDEW